MVNLSDKLIGKGEIQTKDKIYEFADYYFSLYSDPKPKSGRSMKALQAGAFPSVLRWIAENPSVRSMLRLSMITLNRTRL